MNLINPREVISHAFSTRDSVSESSIRAAKITVAQERYIRPAFGDQMFDRMVTGEHSAYVNTYIKPALAHFVRYELIGELALQVGDQGIHLPTSENSDQQHQVNKNDTVNKEEQLEEGTNEATKRNTKVSESTESRTSNDAGQENSVRSWLKSATPAEYRALARQALCDARDLLRQAVSYAENHRALFPDYEPQYPLSDRSCIGGVVL